MRICVNRRSRQGLAPKMLLAIAGIGLVGFILLKQMKAKKASATAPQTTAQSSISVPIINPPAAQASTGPSAPSSTDPELLRRYRSAQTAQDRVTRAIEQGDPRQTTEAQESLQSAQKALQEKKQSMY